MYIVFIQQGPSNSTLYWKVILEKCSIIIIFITGNLYSTNATGRTKTIFGENIC